MRPTFLKVGRLIFVVCRLAVMPDITCEIFIAICLNDNMIGFSTFKTFSSNSDFIVIFGDLIGPICMVVIGLESMNSERVH